MEATPTLSLILADMRRASDVADEASGTSGYLGALVALALIARHYLRELPADDPQNP